MIGSFIIFSCGPSLKVSYHYDQTADFTKYKTFTIFNSENLKDAVSQANHDRFIKAIQGEMIKKGFKEDTSTPDLMVNITAILQDRQSVSSTNYYAYGGAYRPYTWGPGVSYNDYDVAHYKDGSLIIDIVDVKEKKLLWQGIGNKEIDAPSKRPDTDIPKAVNSIMADFPPVTSKTKKTN